MMKFFSILCFLILGPVVLAQDNSINESDLIGCWKSYPEENTFFRDIHVYRPCDYQSIFKSKKMRRFRFRMKLSANDNSSYLKIGATDLHRMVKGRWSFDSETRHLELLNLEMKSIRKWKVMLLEHNLLGITVVK